MHTGHLMEWSLMIYDSMKCVVGGTGYEQGMCLSVCSNKTKHCLKVGRVELKGFFRASQASHGASAGLYILLNFAASCKLR